MGNKPFKPETDAERELADAVAHAEEVDFTGKPDTQRTVRGDFFRALLLGLVGGYDPPPGPVRARVLRISGELDLHGCGDAAQPLPALLLSEVYIENTLKLRSATLGALRIPGGRVGGLQGWGARIGGDLHAPHLVVDDGRIDLANARIDGDIVFRRATGPDNGRLVMIELGATTIARDLDLNGAQLANPSGPVLVADRADIGGGVFLRGEDGWPFDAIGEVRFPGAHIGGSLSAGGARLWAGASGKALVVDRADIGGGVFLISDGDQRFAAQGEVRFSGARIGGTFRTSGARFRAGRADKALSAGGADIGGDMLLISDGDRRFEVEGEVHLVGAMIGGSLSASGSRLRTATSGYALVADRASISGDVLLGCDGDLRFEAEGAVRFRGAQIGGNLDVTGARLRAGVTGDTLVARNAEIAGNVVLRPLEDSEQKPILVGDKPVLFESLGRVRISSARMQNLYIENAVFRAAGNRPALDLDSATIADDLRVSDRLKKYGINVPSTSYGLVDLTGARVGELEDDGGDGWGPEPKEWLLYERGGALEGGGGVSLKLDGFVYDRLASLGEAAPDSLWFRRKNWLDRQYFGGQPTETAFSSQPYEQLSRTFRRAGHVLEARQVSIEKRSAMVRCGIEGWHVRGVQWVFGRMFGYGYSPGRTVVTLLLTFFAAIFFEEGLRDIGALAATEDGKDKSGGSCATTLGLYAFDAILPIVDLGYASQCQVSADAPVLAWAWSGFRVIAWIIVTLAALTFSGVLRRD